MRLLHLADVHLDAGYSAFGDLAEARRGAVLEAFKGLPEVAVEEKVHAVLIAGDLFDGPQPELEVVAAVRETLRRLVDACLPVFLVPGNHDSSSLRLHPYRDLAKAPRVTVQARRTPGRRPEREWFVRDDTGKRLAEKHQIYILARPTFGDPVTVETDEGPLHIYGLAYDRAESEAPLDDFHRSDGDGVHVVVLHGAVQDAPHWRGSPNSLRLTTQALRALDVDYIALGDFHGFRPPESLGGAPACYPGSFAATDLTESGPRGFVVVELEPGSAPRVEQRDAGVAPVVDLGECDVAGSANEVEIAAALAEGVPDGAIPVVRLIGEPDFPLDADRVATELRARFGHAAVTDATTYFAVPYLDELAEADTIAGHVVRLGRRRIEAAPDEEARLAAQRALRISLRALEAG